METPKLIASETNSAVAAQLAYDLGLNNQPRELTTSTGVPVLVLPTGIRAASLEHLLPAPIRANAHLALFTAGDLARYVAKQTRPAGTADAQRPAPHHPVVFCDRKTCSIVAFLDYHHADEARWLNHSAKVVFEPSHQYKRWKAANGQRMSQDAFARFLDEVAKDIATPASSVVVSFAENLEIYSTTVFKSSIKAATGETKLTFTDDRKGDISTEVIEEFTLGIPLWLNGDTVAIRAKLFHRVITDGTTGAKNLNFWFELRHLEEIQDKLFAEEVASLQKDLAGIADIYMGTPPTRPESSAIGIRN